MKTLKTAAVVYLIAVAVNYPWELAQAGLFTAESHSGSIAVHCFIASLGDGGMVLLLFELGRVVLGGADWFRKPGLHGYIVLLATGAALGTAVEWFAVHVLGRWTYADAMPQLPLLNVGLLPILQMILLPPLVFYLAAHLDNRR